MQFVLLLLFIHSLSVFAYQSNLTGSGHKLRWSNKNVSFAIRENSQTLAPATSTQIIRDSINEWNQTSSAKVTENSSATNEITFTNDFSAFGPGVVGMTELLFDEGSGTIQKARILLNENHFQFMSTPGVQSSSYKIFLGDVVTHEIGHLFGLSHSEVLDSSMYYSTFPGQSTLAADDKAAVRSKYDSTFGKIYGYVQGGDHIGVLGAHVQAISLKTGESIGAISEVDGYFEIGGLNLNDSYYLYTSPLKKLDSLPGYFANVQNSFCPANYVGSFFSACGKDQEGLPQKIHLSSLQSEVNVGTVTINCSLRANESYSYEKVQSQFDSVTILDSSKDDHHLAFVGYFRNNEVNTTTYSKSDKLQVDLSHFSALSGSTKYLKVTLITQAFASPVEYALDIKRDGVSQTGGFMTKTIRSPEGTYRLDLGATIPLSLTANQNIYDLEIKARKLPTEDLVDAFPSASLYSSGQHFPYLIMVSVWENTSSGLKPYLDTEVTLSDNDSCLDAPFTYAVSNVKTLQPVDSNEESKAAPVTGCGTIEPPQGGGPSSSLPLLALGFFLVSLASQFMKSRKNFLS